MPVDGELALSRGDRFRAFCSQTEPGLRRALVAAYGPALGSEAAADALAWAWEHFDRVEGMANPVGYLWRVGQTSVRRSTRRQPWLVDANRSTETEHLFEPGLLDALTSLPQRQRAAVLLIHGYGYSLSEAAGLMDCRIRTLRNHLERGLAKLRASLGADDA